MLAAHVLVKRLHCPEKLLAVTAFRELDDVLHSNVIDSSVSARESLAAARNHSSFVWMFFLIVNAEAREGIEVSYTNLATDFAMLLHHSVDFSVKLGFFRAGYSLFK